MDERLQHHGPEQHGESGESDPYKVEQRHEAIKDHAENVAEQHKPKTHEEISRLEKEIAQKAESSADLKNELSSQHVDRDSDKSYNYTTPDSAPRVLNQARKELKPAERTVSKIVHNPKVEAISSITGATVARPSGFLYGAIFSFVFTIGFLMISKRYGYEYNAIVGVITFVIGYLVGLVVELITRTVKQPKKQ